MATKKSLPNYKGNLFRKVFSYNGNKYDVTAKSEEDLYMKIVEKKKALENGDIVINNNTTVAKWIEQWLEMDKKPKLKERSFIEVKALVNNHIVSAIGNMRISDVKRPNLQMILNSQVGKSFSHLSKIRVYITEIFNAAERDDIIEKNPSRFLTLPECTKGTARAMTDVEYNATLKICRNIELYSMKYMSESKKIKEYYHRSGIWILLMLKCGLRRGETVPLAWSDIDFSINSLTINKAVEFINGKPKISPSAKTVSGNRTVKIPNDLLNMLKDEKDKSDTLFVFPNSTNDEMMNEWNIDKLWKNFYRCLDIELGAKVYRNKIIGTKISDNLSMHSLRHTCITRLIIGGANVKDVQIFAGHSDVQTTLNIYTNITKSDAVNRIYHIQNGSNGGSNTDKPSVNAVL